jgi:DNA-binding MarR family transcriptional regulator
VPQDDVKSGPGKGAQGGTTTGSENGSLRLLRDSHIFASAVREVLDVRLLREVSPHPLTPSQFQVLRLMSFNGPHQIGEVAGFLGVSPPAATKNIDKLERLGLVARAPSTGDRRATLLTVSTKGRRLVRKYDQHKAAYLSPVLESFRPAEIERFSDLLERFSVSLLRQQPIGDRFCLRCAGYIEADCPVRRMRGGCRYQKVRSAHAGGGSAEEVP